MGAAALRAKGDGRVASDQHFVFFSNLRSPDGSVEHTRDTLIGSGDGNDEGIMVNLAGVPAEIQRIVFHVSICDADARKQNFGQVSNAFIRVVDQADGAEVVRYDPTENFSVETAMMIGELYRHNMVTGSSVRWVRGMSLGCSASRRTTV